MYLRRLTVGVSDAIAGGISSTGSAPEKPFRDGHHRRNDRVARLCVSGKFGESCHEDAASGCRLRDRNGFRLSSVRCSVLPE